MTVSRDLRPPITDSREVAAVATAIRRAGRLYLDLEFVSEGRYVPELGLVQVAWGDPERPEVAAVDPLAVDPRPLVELVASDEIETVLHAAQGDLALLAARLGVVAERVVDTQIAAGFLGLGDQPGYAALVEGVLGVTLDKSAQFTDWTRRPLDPEQLRYALDDVRYLPSLWRELEGRLAARGRRGWVVEESAALASTAVQRPPPEETYRRVRAWDRLRPRALGALRAAAAWREREALATNTPPRWLLQDGPLIEASRRLPSDERELTAIRGIGAATVRRHGAALLTALNEGAADPPPAPPPERQLSKAVRGQVAALAELIREKCREADVAPRFIAARADAEALIRWRLEASGSGDPPDLPLLHGWRRQVAGDAALAWLGVAGEGW